MCVTSVCIADVTPCPACTTGSFTGAAGASVRLLRWGCARVRASAVRKRRRAPPRSLADRCARSGTARVLNGLGEPRTPLSGQVCAVVASVGLLPCLHEPVCMRLRGCEPVAHPGRV